MGLTVLDAGVLIGFLDSDDSHHASAHAAIRNARDRHDRLALPASAFAEMLVGPSRQGEEAVGTVQQLMRRVPIDIAPLGSEIAAVAAGLRARHRSLKLPDALVIATAAHLDADHLVTTDRGWPTSEKLEVGVTITEI